ncbi:MAG TPA: THUMP domain-containing protein [archaeon]|nr:THUMP domain-containing protein [archaeon]
MLYLVRYGELALKSPPVRQRFERQLGRNLRRSFRAAGLEARVQRSYGRFLVEGPKAVEPILSRTFGIVSFSPCEQLPAQLPTLITAALALAKKRLKPGRSFKVDARRVGAHPFSSQDVNIRIGAAIQKALGNPVNLSKPDAAISLDIRDRVAYLFSETIAGPGGLPVGSGSPVAVLFDRAEAALAGWLLLRRGSPIQPILLKKGAERWLTPLESWSPMPFKPVRSLAQSRAIAIASAETDLAKLATAKSASALPLLFPLAGMPKARIQEFAKRMRR